MSENGHGADCAKLTGADFCSCLTEHALSCPRIVDPVAECTCGATPRPGAPAEPKFFSVWQWQTAAVDYVCVAVLTDEADALEIAGKHRHEMSIGGVSVQDPKERKPAAVLKHPTWSTRPRSAHGGADLALEAPKVRP